MKIDSEYGKIILRISLSLVFLYFGIVQLYSPLSWVGFVPDFFSTLISANKFVILNACLEIVLGLTLMFGVYTRFSSLVLSAHLFGIAFSIGLSPLGVRDLGLAFATLAVFFNGGDKFCLDRIKKE